MENDMDRETNGIHKEWNNGDDKRLCKWNWAKGGEEEQLRAKQLFQKLFESTTGKNIIPYLFILPTSALYNNSLKIINTYNG